MQRDYPGIKMHLGFYGPRVSDEPIAQMKPRLAESEMPAEPESLEGTATSQRYSRVEIRTNARH